MTIKEVREIPPLNYTEYASFEFGLMDKSAREHLVRFSKHIRQIDYNGKPVLVAGLFKSTLMSPYYLWVLITEELRAVPPSGYRTLIHQLGVYPGTKETFINEEHDGTERLARLFGFIPTNFTMPLGSLTLRLYRRAT